MEKRKILLVDDVSLFIQLEKSFLSRDLFEITTARSGRDALSSARANTPDLVLLDLYMPDMNGDAVCRELKNDPATKNIPIVMVSSEGEKDAEMLCHQAGCDDFIYKPIRRDLLLAAVERQLKVTHRRHVRINTDLPCTVRHNEQIFDARISSLSQSGGFIEMGFTPDLEVAMVVVFSLPQSDKVLELNTCVRWTGKSAEDGSLGAGVEFPEIDTKCSSQIKIYIDSIIK